MGGVFFIFQIEEEADNVHEGYILVLNVVDVKLQTPLNALNQITVL